jgi:hypothetical protein
VPHLRFGVRRLTQTPRFILDRVSRAIPSHGEPLSLERTSLVLRVQKATVQRDVKLVGPSSTGLRFARPDVYHP